MVILQNFKEYISNSVKSDKTRITYICLISCFINVLSLDIITPIMPYIVRELSISAQELQSTIGICFTISILGRSVSGYLADRYSHLILLALIAMTSFLGNLISFRSETYLTFAAGRFLFSIGAGGMTILASVIFHKMWSKNQLASQLAWLEILPPIAFTCSPIVSVFISNTCGWQYNFLFLALFQLLAFTTLFFWSRDIGYENKEKRSNNIYSSYRAVLRNRGFLFWACSSCFIVATYTLISIQAPLIYAKEISEKTWIYALYIAMPAYVQCISAISVKYILKGSLFDILKNRINFLILCLIAMTLLGAISTNTELSLLWLACMIGVALPVISMISIPNAIEYLRDHVGIGFSVLSIGRALMISGACFLSNRLYNGKIISVMIEVFICLCVLLLLVSLANSEKGRNQVVFPNIEVE